MTTRSHASRARKPLRIAAIATSALISCSALAPSAQAVDSNADNIDDALIVSFAAAGVQSFTESDAGSTDSVSMISFDNTGTPSYTASGLTNGTSISALNISSGSAQAIGTGAGTLNIGNALVWGGAGATGQYAVPGGTSQRWTLSFTNTQQYLGLWWSAGNGDNNVQFLNASGGELLSPAFTTASMFSALLNGNSCPGTRPSAADIASQPWKGYCGNPNLTYGYVAEPFAFVHFRFPAGFRKVQLWGTGFEFDNLTFSQTVPTFGAAEEVVGTSAASATLPSVLLVDPRSTTISLPALNLSNSNNAMMCIKQVADALGTAMSGSATITVGRSSNTAGVTETVATNLWRYSGTRAAVQSQIPTITISGTSGQPLVPSTSKFINIHVTSDTSGASACTDSQVNTITELRGVGMKTNSSTDVNF
jgi:hypothetical protein